jgi:hypothetical protein
MLNSIISIFLDWLRSCFVAQGKIEQQNTDLKLDNKVKDEELNVVINDSIINPIDSLRNHNF